MKFYNLHIDFEPSWDTYNRITEVLNVIPRDFEKSRFNIHDEPSNWHYQIVEDEEVTDKPIDFINVLLDIVEPNFSKLKRVGIEKDNILFWLVYEYQHQCSMEFHPEEMERLGKSGIGLNIDCLDGLKIKKTKAE